MNTAKEIAQWVIDNRYPKSENEKVSDMEMYHELVESIEKLCNIPPVSKSVTCHHPLPYRKSTGRYTPGYTCTLCGKFVDR